ncbi:MAG: FliH/SctL family protein [Candidatus Eremiobacteraeota bacterium]|nr:FliH/SctL family protein [Candidatus Eremiobacteraeota bacterium]
MKTPEPFLSLESLLRPAPKPPDRIDEPEVPQSESLRAHESYEHAARDVRLFRARLREALDGALQTLIADIASDVLARELQLAPCDVAAIVERATARYASEMLVSVRVHPADAPTILASDLHVIGDSTLRRGDAILACAAGEIDASLGVHLGAVLRSFEA